VSRRSFCWALGLVTVLGALPRLLTLGHGLWGDELFTYAIAAEPSLDDALSLMRETENTPPLSYLAAWVAAQVAVPEVAIRLLPLASGIAMAPLAGLAGARAFGRRAGIVGAALVAVSPFAVFYGAEGRAYAPAACAVLAAAWTLTVALDDGRRRWWVATGVAAAAAVWFHYTAVFPLAAQFAWAFFARREHRRALVLTFGAAALAYAPWLPFLEGNAGRAILAALSPVTAGSIVDVPARMWIGHPDVGLADFPGRWGAALLGLALAGAGVLALRESRWRADLAGLARGPAGMHALMAATPAVILLYSVLADSIWRPRNLLVSLAPALLIAAAVLAAPRGRAWIAASAVAVAVFAAGTVRTSTEFRRPAYDELAARLDRVAAPPVPVIERSLIEVPGPLREHLSAWFERPHRHVQADSPDVAAAWEEGVRVGRAFVVTPTTNAVEPDPRFALVSRHVESGLLDLEVLEYAPR
jgi:mannosyltransferase